MLSLTNMSLYFGRPLKRTKRSDTIVVKEHVRNPASADEEELEDED